MNPGRALKVGRVLNPGRLALAVLVGLALLAFGAPLWTALLGIDPFVITASGPDQPITVEHWLGTDAVGRDVWARLLYGARTSFAVALSAAALAAFVGGGLGAWAGFVGGGFDEAVVRATEATMTVPKLPLLLLLAAVELPGGGAIRVVFLVGLMALMAWPGPARMARSTAQQCRHAGFVQASRALGASGVQIWWAHVLPRTIPVLSVSAAGDVAELLLLESLLSYLGFGIPEPAPSLGNLLSPGLASLFEAPWTLVAPGLLTVGAVASLHVLADRWAAQIDPHRTSPRLSGAGTVLVRDE